MAKNRKTRQYVSTYSQQSTFRIGFFLNFKPNIPFNNYKNIKQAIFLILSVDIFVSKETFVREVFC